MACVSTAYRYGIWSLDNSISVVAQNSQPMPFLTSAISSTTTGVTVALGADYNETAIKFHTPGVWRVNATVAIGNLADGWSFESWFGPWEPRTAIGLRSSTLPKPGYTKACGDFNGDIVTLRVDLLVEIASSLIDSPYSLCVFNGHPTASATPLIDQRRSIIEAHLLEDWTVE